MKNSIILWLLVINTCFLILSFAISIPIICRPFYYYHIHDLHLEQETGYTHNEIKEAYNDVLDYLVLNKDFQTGKLKYSEEGKNHFQDCKVLFTINFIVLGVSLIINVLRLKFYPNMRLFNYSISFWSSCLLIFFLFKLLLISFISGFDKCFDTFHNIFFLGKDNWLLSPETDEIINIFPMEFFRNCAILVLSIIGIVAITIVIREIMKKARIIFNN